MKRHFLLLITLVLFIGQTFAANRYWISNTNSNWNNSANWSSSNGGSGGYSVPATGDRVYFNNNGTGNCVIDINVGVDGINVYGTYTGIIDLNGYTFNTTVSGSADCNFLGGTISDAGSSSVTHNSTGMTVFGGTTFNTPINVTAKRIQFSGGIFNDAVVVADNSNSSTNGAGGCTFNSTFQVTNSGSSYFLMGQTNPDIFNGDVTLINTSSSRIRLAYSSTGTQFNGNITIASNNGSGIYIGENGGTSTLASNKSIIISGSGFSKGELLLKGFVQSGNTSQNITLSGTAYLKALNGTSFNGNVVFTAPQIQLTGATFNGTSEFTKTGASSNYSGGGNTFVGNCILKNSGSASLILGNGAPDTFSANLELKNEGTSSLYLAHNSAGNSITGNLTVTNLATGSNTYVHLAQNTASTLTVTGNSNFTNSTSSSNGQIIVAENGDVVFNNNVTATNNATGNSGTITFATNSNASAIINGTTNITNNGSGTTKRMQLGYSGDVTFNGDLTLTNNASANNSEIFLNHNPSASNMYNGNINISNTHNSGDGIRFGQSAGVGTLAATKNINIAGTFASGELRLRNFSHTNTGSQYLQLSGTAYLYISGSSFTGNVHFRSPRIYTAHSTYSGTSIVEKTGATNDASIGGNTFVGNCELKNSGSGYFLMGNGNPDTFGGNLVLNNTGTNHMYLAHNSAGNLVQGDLTFNNMASGINTYMYASSYSASTLSVNGKANFNLNTSSSNGQFIIGENGDITFNDDLSATNNANGNSGSMYFGSNTNSSISINGNTSIINNGSGTTKRVYFGNNGDITCNGNFTVTNNSTATNSEIYIANSSNAAHNFNGNISLTNSSPDGIRFGQSNGSTTLSASGTITNFNYSSGELRLRNFTQIGATDQSLNLNNTGYLILQNASFGGNIDFRAPRTYLTQSTFAGTSYIEKKGASDDQCAGGNTFVGNTELKNSGSGYLMMGNGSADDFQGNLIMNNTGSRHMYLAYNSAGNNVAGTLTINNSGYGSGNSIILANRANSSLTVNQIAQISNTSSASTSNLSLGRTGAITFNGNLVINNAPSGSSSTIYMAYDSASTVNINGTATITGAAGGSTRRMYLGNKGDIVFNSDLFLTQNSNASSSEVYLNHDDDSHNQYKGNIVLTSNTSSCDGIRFGESGGSGELAATKTITIGTNGFKSGVLRLKNFTQLGNTAQTLNPTGTTYFILANSYWGGNVDFRSPRIFSKLSTFNGTTHLEKTGGISDDNNYGGNTFHGVTTLVNSGSKTFNLANINIDIFNADVQMINSGTSQMTLAKNQAGHIVNGNLTVTNSGTGTGNSYTHLASGSTATLHVTGNLVVNHTGSAKGVNSKIADNGTVTVDGNFNATNSAKGTNATIRIANGSTGAFTVHGTTSIINNNTASSTNRIYLGANGDVTLNGTADLVNKAGSSSSEFYVAHESSGSIVFNDHVTISSLHTNCDGFYFGQSGGSSVLAATKTITIPGIDVDNFIGGDLRFYNFTQTGTTPHAFELASTARYIYSKNSNWGGAVSFVSPRNYMHTSTFDQQAYFIKTGKDNDDWYGGNIFNGNTEIVQNNNVASGRLYLATYLNDTYNGNLTLRNKGSFSELLCGNRQGTYTVNGDLNIYHETKGTGNQYFYLANNNATIFNITGDVNVTNSSTGISGSHNMYISNRGLVNIAGNLSVNNTANNGTNRYIYLGASGDITVGGDMNLTNNSSATNSQIILANGSSSSVIVSGSSTLNNSSTGNNSQCYLGNYGDVTFNGDLEITNNSGSSYSEIHANYRINSVNIYNGNITVKSTQTNSDGILFGNHGGTGTLAATKTITTPLPATQFIGGQLYFRNFNQIGATPQNLELAATANRIYNYNSNWGGNHTEKAPSILTYSTTYGGATLLEKIGSTNDASSGANTFVGNTELKNTGTGYFLMGNGTADDFQANVVMNNLGTNNMYIAHNSRGNTIGGDLTVNHNTTGTSNYSYVSTGSNSNLTIGGNTTVNNNSSAASSYIYFGDQGDVTLNGDLALNNLASNNNSQILLGSSSRSSISVNGNTQISNNGAGTYKRIYLGYSGDIIFNGNVSIENNASATYSEIQSNYASASTNNYNGNITISSTVSGCDGVRFGESGGNATLANSKTISIGSSFISGYLRLRNFSQMGSAAQNLTLTDNSIMILDDSDWYGNVTFSSPRIKLKNSLFDGISFFEKTGSTNDLSTGGNMFNDETTFKNSSTSYFAPCYRSANDFNANVTYWKASTGAIYPAYDVACTYANNITVNSNTTVRFGNGGSGRVVFDGPNSQTINQLGSATTIEFRDLQTNKTGGEVTLNTPVSIFKDLDLDNGNVVTTSTNVLTMTDNTIVRSVSNNAYVDGPVIKYGNDAFTFPIGAGGYYAPLKMSQPGTATFKASYHHDSPHSNGFDSTEVAAGLDHISNTEYWMLDRLTGTSDVKATLSFVNTRSDIDGAGTPCNIRVAHWTGTQWENLGNGGATGSLTNGEVITGISEDCTNSTKITNWATNQPLTLAVDSNFITWDGTAYNGGTGASSAPGPADGTRVLKVYAPNAILPADAEVAQVIVTPSGHLTIENGTSLEVNGSILNTGDITIESGGSLIQTGTGTNENSGAGEYHVKRTGNLSAASYNIWSSPIQTPHLDNVFTGSNPCDIWTFDELNQAWTHDYAIGYTSTCYGNNVTFSASDVIAGGDGLMDAGRGYFVPGTTVNTRVYDGQVNNGDLFISISTTNLGHNPNWDNDDWNLVGNPYPSSLDADAFLLENATNNNRIDGAIYFWDAGDTTTGYNQHSDYATYNMLGGVRSGNSTVTPGGQIASGQGFWVYAHANTSLEFNNSMRSSSNDQFFKKDPVKNHLAWIDVVNPNSFKNNILIGYNETTTDSLDAAYDAHKLEGSTNIRFASLIGKEEFAIQGIKSLSLGDTKSIPIVIWSADSGIHTFSNYQTQNIPSHIKIYLKDNDLNEVHELTSAYSASLDANVTYTERFEIIFEYNVDIAGGGQGSKGSGNSSGGNDTNITSIDETLIEKYTVKNTPDGFLLEHSTGIYGAVTVLDITGKTVWSKSNLTGSTSEEINIQELSTGIYFIEVINKNKRLFATKVLKRKL